MTTLVSILLIAGLTDLADAVSGIAFIAAAERFTRLGAGLVLVGEHRYAAP